MKISQALVFLLSKIRQFWGQAKKNNQVVYPKFLIEFLNYIILLEHCAVCGVINMRKTKATMSHDLITSLHTLAVESSTKKRTFVIINAYRNARGLRISLLLVQCNVLFWSWPFEKHSELQLLYIQHNRAESYSEVVFEIYIRFVISRFFLKGTIC